jgi:hypothetical protein
MKALVEERKKLLEGGADGGGGSSSGGRSGGGAGAARGLSCVDDCACHASDAGCMQSCAASPWPGRCLP